MGNQLNNVMQLQQLFKSRQEHNNLLCFVMLREVIDCYDNGSAFTWPRSQCFLRKLLKVELESSFCSSKILFKKINKNTRLFLHRGIEAYKLCRFTFTFHLWELNFNFGGESGVSSCNLSMAHLPRRPEMPARSSFSSKWMSTLKKRSLKMSACFPKFAFPNFRCVLTKF